MDPAQKARPNDCRARVIGKQFYSFLRYLFCLFSSVRSGLRVQPYLHLSLLEAYRLKGTV